MKEKGYMGVNIDFENVLPNDRELYNQFLQRTLIGCTPRLFCLNSSSTKPVVNKRGYSMKPTTTQLMEELQTLLSS